MTARLSRLGLLAAALALPLAAVVVSYVSGADPGPDVPVEVRIGGPGGGPGDPVPPLPEGVRVPVVADQPAEIWTGPEPAQPGQALSGSVSETVVPAPPPVVVDAGQPGPDESAAKAKTKSKSNRGATPPGRGRAAAGNG